MISDYEQLKKYWKSYIDLELDFLSSKKYLRICDSNLKTHSTFFLDLILSLGSEIDILFQFICHLYGDDTSKTITGYKGTLNREIPNICSEQASLYDGISNPQIPFKNLNSSTPDWWLIYQEIKHNDREKDSEVNGNKIYVNANLENVLLCLGALYILLQLCNKKINRKKFLLPFSTLFKTFADGTEFSKCYIRQIDNGDGTCTLDIWD